MARARELAGRRVRGRKWQVAGELSELVELGKRFARFRKAHPRGTRIPDDLREAALELLREVAPADSVSDLRHQLRAGHGVEGGGGPEPGGAGRPGLLRRRRGAGPAPGAEGHRIGRDAWARAEARVLVGERSAVRDDGARLRACSR